MSQSTHIHAFPLPFCGVQLQVNLHHNCHAAPIIPHWTRTIHKKTVEKNTRKGELKVTNHNSHEPEKRGQLLHISRSKATLLQIWTKVTTHMMQSMVAHERVTASNSSQSNTPCSPSTGACSCLWCVQKISGANMPRFRYHQTNQTSRMHIQKSVAPTCHVFQYQMNKAAGRALRNLQQI